MSEDETAAPTNRLTTATTLPSPISNSRTMAARTISIRLSRSLACFQRSAQTASCTARRAAGEAHAVTVGGRVPLALILCQPARAHGKLTPTGNHLAWLRSTGPNTVARQLLPD
jgi:hypothetical protein